MSQCCKHNIINSICILEMLNLPVCRLLCLCGAIIRLYGSTNGAQQQHPGFYQHRVSWVFHQFHILLQNCLLCKSILLFYKWERHLTVTNIYSLMTNGHSYINPNFPLPIFFLTFGSHAETHFGVRFVVVSAESIFVVSPSMIIITMCPLSFCEDVGMVWRASRPRSQFSRQIYKLGPVSYWALLNTTLVQLLSFF